VRASTSTASYGRAPSRATTSGGGPNAVRQHRQGRHNRTRYGVGGEQHKLHTPLPPTVGAWRPANYDLFRESTGRCHIFLICCPSRRCAGWIGRRGEVDIGLPHHSGNGGPSRCGSAGTEEGAVPGGPRAGDPGPIVLRRAIRDGDECPKAGHEGGGSLGGAGIAPPRRRPRAGVQVVQPQGAAPGRLRVGRLRGSFTQ
jgi:hypothetical protein